MITVFLKKLIKSILPASLLKPLLQTRRFFSNVAFFNQGSSKVNIGIFNINCPSKHPIQSLIQIQPYRDLCVGIAAKYFSQKYPKSVLIDIGANIGDTAAIIATHSHNKLILVEPSKFFYNYLLENINLFPNEIVTHNVFISSGEILKGKLNHWGGTAFIDHSGEDQIITRSLAEIQGSNVSFIKIDTDGFDQKIILSNIQWFIYNKPGLLFENQIFKQTELDQSTLVFNELIKIGYQYFMFFDDAGFFIISLESAADINYMNMYLYKIHSTTEARKSVAGYDILCFNKRDKDLHNSIVDFYTSY